MNYKLNLSILIIYLLQHTSIHAQDQQWLILNGNVKTGYHNDQNVYNLSYNNIINNNNTFSIEGALHPNNYFGKNPRNDVFIIYDDGTFFNSRKINPSSCWPNFTLEHPGPYEEAPKSYTIQGLSGKIMKYFYLSNIYEDDDPPSNIKITNATTFTPMTVGISSTSIMQANHDFVPGTDVTLIIPNNLFNNCTIASLGFDSNVFEPSNVFQDGSSCSFNIIPGMSINGNSINGITIPSNYHYFNFKVKENLNSTLMGNSYEFTLKCGTTVLANLVDTLRTGHDPSFIKVKCLFKKNVKGIDKYYALYHIQFQNTGNHIVDSVKVRFSLPSSLKNNKIKLFHWYYGGYFGCGENLPDGVKLKYNNNKFEFSFGYPFINPGSINPLDPNPSSKGVAEFCVEIKQNPETLNVDLQPINARTYFDNVESKFDYYFDPKIKINNKKVRKLSPNCRCNCK